MQITYSFLTLISKLYSTAFLNVQTKYEYCSLMSGECLVNEDKCQRMLFRGIYLKTAAYLPMSLTVFFQSHSDLL